MSKENTLTPWNKVRDDLKDLRDRIAEIEGVVAGLISASAGPGSDIMPAEVNSGRPGFNLAAALSRLGTMKSQPDILETLLDETRSVAERGVLFIRVGEGYSPWKAFGFQEESLQDLFLTDARDPVLRAAVEDRLIEMEGDIQHLTGWIGESPEHISHALAMPVLSQDPAPLVFYCDSSRSIDSSSIESLFALGRLVLQNHYLTQLVQSPAPSTEAPEPAVELVPGVEGPPAAEEAPEVPTGDIEEEAIAATAEAETLLDESIELDLGTEEGEDLEEDSWLGGEEPPLLDEEEEISETARQFLAEIARAEEESSLMTSIEEASEVIDAEEVPQIAEEFTGDGEEMSILDQELNHEPTGEIFDSEVSHDETYRSETDIEDQEPQVGEIPSEAPVSLELDEESDELQVVEAGEGEELKEEPAVPPDLAIAFEVNRAEEEALHDEARRFARLLVTEIKLYNEDDVLEGRQAGDLYSRLQRDIERSREMYEKRAHPVVRVRVDYLHTEMLRILAQDNASLMGDDYPGPQLTDFLDTGA